MTGAAGGPRERRGESVEPTPTPAEHERPTQAPQPRGLDPEMTAALLDILVGESSIGLYVLDADLRRIPDGMDGVPAPGEAGAGADPSLAAALATPEVRSLLRRALKEDRSVHQVRCTVHPPHATAGEGRVLSVSARPLHDRDRRPLGIAVTLTDTTATERAQRNLELLGRADTMIGSSLDVFRTAQELAAIAVPGLADGAAVDVLDVVFHGNAPPPGPLLEPATVRRAGFVTVVDLKGHAIYEVGSVRVMQPGKPYAHALADLTPRVVNDLSDDDAAAWLSRDPGRAALFRSVHVHSMVLVPLAARGVVLGLAAFYRAGDSEPFDDMDADVAQKLAARAALSLDNARLYTRERTLARIAQRQLLPGRVPTTWAVETAHAYLPVAAGGSWFDVIPLPGARVALVAGDVWRSGLRAATAMGQLRTAVHAFAAMDLEPVELLVRLHELTATAVVEEATSDLLAQGDGLNHDAVDTDDASPASCLYVVYDPVNRECQAVSAAHPPPVVTPSDGAPYTLDMPVGPALGRGTAEYRLTTFPVPAGSVLALFNQGLVRGRGRAEDGLAALVRALAGAPRRPLKALRDRLMTSVLPEGAEDDALLLLARTRGLGPHHLAYWELPDDPRSAGRARRLVAGRLTEWGEDALIPSAELLVSEVVTNSVRYAEGTIGLRLIRADSTICEVTDSVSAAPHLRLADDTDEGGRGLYLVSRFASRWGTRYSARGKTVWFELPHD